MKYEGIIFDLDGTLIDSLVDIAASMNRVLVRNGFPAHEFPAYRFFIGNGMINLVRRTLPEDVRSEDELVSRLFREMLDDYREHCLDKTKPFAGITDLLDILSERKLRLTILSNKVDELTKKVVKTLFSGWSFEIMLGTSEQVPRKPDPTGIKLISESLDIVPEKLLYLGDSGVDMQVANKVGIMSVGVLWGYRTKEELIEYGAKALIQHPLELIPLLD
jgi:phosphoglycolate phosphatase